MPPLILIIDDEEGMCWTLEKTLNQEGYEVISETSWLEGLLRIRTGEIDLVLLDINILEMDALTVLEQIRKTSVPFLIMTDYNTIPVAAEAVQKGACGYLTKPFSISSLKMAVKNVLRLDIYPRSREHIYR